MKITKLWTGVWSADHDGQNVGGIRAEQPPGGIRQSFVQYEAHFKPSPDSEGFSYRGTVHGCKRFLNDWSKVMGWH